MLFAQRRMPCIYHSFVIHISVYIIPHASWQSFHVISHASACRNYGRFVAAQNTVKRK